MTDDRVSEKIGKRIATILIASILPILILLIWQWSSDAGVLNKSILPGPVRVVEEIVRLIEKGTYKKHIIASFSRILKGYIISSIVGIVLGILLALFTKVNQFFVAIIGILQPIPSIACVPFFILWLGIGEASKIAVIVLGTFWPVLLNTIQGIKSADYKLIEVGNVLEKNRFQILFQIIFPSAIPAIFTGLRLGMANAIACVVGAEMIAASAGIGFLISYGRELAQPETLLVGIATIGVVGLIVDISMLKLQKHFLYWNELK